MNFITNSLVFLMFSLIFPAFADNAPAKEFQAQIISIEKYASSTLPVLDQRDGKNKVFIHAVAGWSSTYPKIANAVKERMRSHGIHVVDKSEDADIGLELIPLAGSDFDEIEADADSDGNAVSMENVMVFLASVITHTPSYAVSPFSGSSKNSKLPKGESITVIFFPHPKIGSRGKMSGDEGETFGNFKVVYSANEYGVKSSTFALASIVDKLIADHFTVDTVVSPSISTLK